MGQLCSSPPPRDTRGYRTSLHFLLNCFYLNPFTILSFPILYPIPPEGCV